MYMIQNYVQLIYRIIEYGKAQDIVRTCGEGDIYKINDIPDLDYPIFWVASTQGHVEHANYTKYNLTLYYVDRQLIETDSEHNDDNAMIISAGMSILSNTIKMIKNDADVYSVDDNIVYNTFIASDGVFNDKCAGVYCNISVNVPNYSTCVE